MVDHPVTLVGVVALLLLIALAGAALYDIFHWRQSFRRDLKAHRDALKVQVEVLQAETDALRYDIQTLQHQNDLLKIEIEEAKQ